MAKYVISDLHCRFDLFKTLYESLKADDTLYVLGDTIDRGTFEDAMGIYNICMEDRRVIHLLGNHEDMVFQRLRDIINDSHENGRYAPMSINPSDWEYQLWRCNGGGDIIQALKDGRFKLDDIIKLYEYILSMPVIVEDEGYVLSHAGIGDILDKDFTLWNVNHEKLADRKQVIGHVYSLIGEHKDGNIIYVDTSNFKNERLGVFELTEEKLFHMGLKC